MRERRDCRRGRRSAAVGLALLVGLAGCDDGDEGGEPTGPERQPGATEQGAETERPTGPDGEELPGDPGIWRDEPEQTVRRQLRQARARAREHDRRVLLEFVAPWCDDCREVVRLQQKEPVKSLLEQRYEIVHVNVGRFDRHEALLSEHEVDRIATLVVLTPKGERVARTTLEPISRGGGLTPQALAQWLARPEEAPPPPGATR